MTTRPAPGYPPAVLEAEHILAASLALDPATATHEQLVELIVELQRATGLALDAHAALHAATPDAPDATRDAIEHPTASESASENASADPLLDRARQLDHAHRTARGRPAPLRKLQTELRIGQPRAQELQRALAATRAPATPAGNPMDRTRVPIA